MLAGLPPQPGRMNPVTDFKRAKARQRHVQAEYRVGPEAQVRGLDFPQVLQHESGPDEQDHGQRDLAHHQPAP